MNDQPAARSQEFPYSRMDSRREAGVLRPLLPLALNYGREQIDAIGLLDTEADVNVLPYDLGSRFGARWEAQAVVPDLSGNLGRYEARGLILTAQIGAFPPRRLVFAWTRAEGVPLILGQVNFFLE